MLTESEKRKRDMARVRRQRWIDKNPGYAAKYKNDPAVKMRLKTNRAARYIEHKEIELAQMKVWRANNKDRIREHSKRWAKANPEKERIRLQNKRHKMVGSLSKGLAKRLLILQKGQCIACRIDITINAYEMDHIEPLKLGGLNIDSNIQLLCCSCNSKKSAKPPHQFMQERGYLL